MSLFIKGFAAATTATAVIAQAINNINADGIGFFQVQTQSGLDAISGYPINGIGVGLGLPACGYDQIGGVPKNGGLTDYQFSCEYNQPPSYLQMAIFCQAGTTDVDLYRLDNGDFDAYCAGGDGSVIGQCYYRCESTDCTTAFIGSVSVKLLDCYFEPCQCA